MHNFLKDVVIPYYQAQSQQGNNFVIYDIQMKVLVASESVAKRLNFQSAREMVEKSYVDFKHIKPELLPQLKAIFNHCITNKITTHCVSIGGQLKPRFKNYHELIFQALEPIVDVDNNVIAILAKKLPVINSNLFHLFFPEYKAPSEIINQQITEELSEREFEIVYLSSNGLSQYEIADRLQISRSTVLKTITDRILPKSNLTESNSKELIKFAIALGIHTKIPKSLIKEQLIIITAN